jgi:hypothetical protein
MGCETNVPTKHSGITIDGDSIQETVIDSCQYLFDRVNGGIALTHKGNCNNPIHKQN